MNRAPLPGELDGDRSLQELGELLDESETEPGAALRSCACSAELLEPLEENRLLLDRDPWARIGDLELEIFALSRAEPNGDPPGLGGELERVSDQVENDLFDQLRIEEDRTLARIDLEREADALCGRRGAEVIDSLREEPCEVDGAPVGFQLAGLRLAEVEKIVHENEEASGIPMHALEIFEEVRGQLRSREYGLERTEDQGQRRPELVADVREEIGLELVDLFEPSLLILERAQPSSGGIEDEVDQHLELLDRIVAVARPYSEIELPVDDHAELVGQFLDGVTESYVRSRFDYGAGRCRSIHFQWM